MALIEYTLDGKLDRVQQAIDRIKAFDPIANGWDDKPYYVAYSGGKDSDAIRILFQLAGVKHELWHNHTTVDAPETVYYVRSIANMHYNYPELSMWELIVKIGMPPTRLARYCCEVLKEHGGEERISATGVRWAESNGRKINRGGVEVIAKKKKDSVILHADNDESRRLFEQCVVKGKRVVNPIVDWSDYDVWELLKHHGCHSNPLYQCGYKRVGCVGCPMAGGQAQKAEFEQQPKYKANYIRAFDRMLHVEGRVYAGNWQTGQDVYDWWVGDAPTKIDENAITMFDESEDDT